MLRIIPESDCSLQKFNETLSQIRQLLSYRFESEEDFEVNVKELFAEHATHLDREESEIKMLFENSFIKYLQEIPVFVAQKIFNSFCNGRKKYLTEEEFMYNLKLIKYAQGVELIGTTFQIFDFDSDGIVQYKDMKLLSYMMVDKLNKIKGLEKLSFASQSELDDILLKPFSQYKSINFNEFVGIIIQNPEVNMCFYVYIYLYLNLPIYRNLLLLYKMKSKSYKSASLAFSSNSREDSITNVGMSKHSQMSGSFANASEDGICILSPKRRYGSVKLSSLNHLPKVKAITKERVDQDAYSMKVLENALKLLTENSNSPSKNASNKSIEDNESPDYVEKTLTHPKKRKSRFGINMSQTVLDHKSKPYIDLIDHQSLEEAEKEAHDQGKKVDYNVDHDHHVKNFSTESVVSNNSSDLLVSLKFQLEETKKLESEINRQKKLEDYLYVPSEIKSPQDSKEKVVLEKRYLILINNALYTYYRKEDPLESYVGNKYLVGSFIRFNQSCKINGILYSSLTIFYQNNKSDTFFHSDKEIINKWVTMIRSCINYRNLFDYYCLEKEIGKGGFGKVYFGKELGNNSNVAIKIIEKNEVYKSNWIKVKTEIDIMKLLRHRNIVKFIDNFENSTFSFIVMEFIPYGSLSDFLKSVQFRLSEKASARIVSQISSALQYLHRFGIIHRDLKPDNILVASKDLKGEEVEVKLADFGLGKILGEKEIVLERCGTVSFTAPEIFKKKAYDCSVDVWSLGITIHYILTGELLFNHKLPIEQNIHNIVHQKIIFSSKLDKYSSNAKDLLQKCLTRDVKKRITIDEILHHPWITQS